MTTLLLILIATILDSLVAFVGAISLFMSKKKFEKIILYLVAFSSGALLGGAFLHLYPESVEHLGMDTSSLALLAGFSLFFIMERVLHWHHCHERKCKVHPVSYLILIGDGLHNFIDGLVIAASFVVSPMFGIVTTVLVIAHEIPQELGDFAVLVYGGMKRLRALMFNFVSQVTCVLGGILGFYLSSVYSVSYYLLPIAAGGFIYISASDLIPALHKEESIKRSAVNFILFLVGLAFIFVVKALEV